MQDKINNLPKEAKLNQKANIKITKIIKKRKPKDFDYLMQDIHNEVFAKTDCLLCGNCCKTTSPIVTEKDLERIAKHLRLKPVDFIKQYLEKDTDNLWMFKETPCVFLDNDNYCFIYDVRPKACREYPHLDRSKNMQLLNLHVKNTEICPAVFDAFELLKEKIKH